MLANRNAYFPYIDGMRAIAVLSVVVYHLHGAWLPGGFGGVDVFFVISGFIVSASVGSLERYGLHRFIPFFYARRLLRIAPALIVCLLLTSLLSALLIPAAWLSQSNQQTGLYAFFGLSNLILTRTNNDYFSPVVDFNPFTHTWSLGVEEQFYFIFPVLFFAWTFRARWRGLTVAMFALAFLASLWHSAELGVTDKTSAYYLITSRFWQLASGVLLYQAMVLGGRRFDIDDQQSPRWFSAGAWVSILALGYGLIVGKAEAFPYPGSLPIVLGALGLLLFLHGKTNKHVLVRMLSAKSTLYVGRISYSLYLWHWPVFVLFRWTVGLDQPVMRWGALLAAFGAAALSYRYVETPIRHIPSLRSAPRWVVVACGLVAVAGSAWGASLINAAQPQLSTTTVARHADDWYPDGKDSDPAYPGCRVKLGIAGVGNGFASTFSRAGCLAPVNAPRLYAIGDSHAVAYIPMYKQYVLSTGASVTLYNNGGCPFMSMQPWREEDAACTANAGAAVADLLSVVRPGDVLFLASLRMPRFADQFVRYGDAAVMEQIYSERAVTGRERAEKQAVLTLRKFRDRGVVVVFEAPTPVFKSPPFRCAEAYNGSNSACKEGVAMPRDEIIRLRQPAFDALTHVAQLVPGVSIWDPMPILCPPGPACNAFADNRPLFFDGDHISGYGNNLLLPSFTGFVRNESSK